MCKLFKTWVICCVFGAIFVKGSDKYEFLADALAKLYECVQEVGAQYSDVVELALNKTSSTMEGKCFRSCIMKKYGLMDDNGKLVKGVAFSHGQELEELYDGKLKVVEEVIEICSNIEVADDHCEAAEEYSKCLHKQYIAHGFEDGVFKLN